MRALFGLIVASTFWDISAIAAPISQDSIKRIIEKYQLQTALPLSSSDSAGNSQLMQLNLPAGLGDVLLWLVVLTGAGVIIWSLRDSLPMFDRSRKILAENDNMALRAVSNEMAKAQIEADDLAGHGLYAEAMHLLLLQSLTELKKRLALTFSDSLTSREILRRANISDQAKSVLGSIIHTVEFTHFGERPASKDDYASCRDQFDYLKAALIGGARI